MASLGKLRDANPMYKRLSVACDMIKPDQAELKKLIAEAKEKEKTQIWREWMYRDRDCMKA